MDRKQLFTEVLADLNRDDKADRLPGWLENAEFLINENLRDDRMLKHAVLQVTERVFPVPPNFVAANGNLSIRSGSDPAKPGPILHTLYYFPEDELNNGQANPRPGVPARGPLWYTTKGRFIELAGWNAEGPYLVDMWYYGELDKLPDDNSSNWLLDRASHIYKNLMLAFGFRHLQEFDTSDRYQMLGMGEIQALNDRNEEKKIAKGPLMMRPTQGFGARANWRRR